MAAAGLARSPSNCSSSRACCSTASRPSSTTASCCAAPSTRQIQVISERLQQGGQQLPPRNVLRQQVLERLVLQEIQMQRADRLGIKVSDEMVNQALTEVAQRNKIKFSDLPAVLEQQGVDYRSYRDDIRQEMTLQMLRQRDVLSRIYVSPRELDQCIAKRKASPGADNEYNLSHILVAVPSSRHRAADRGAHRARRRASTSARRRARTSSQLAIAYSDCRHRARRRRARLAQGGPAALLRGRRRSRP